MTDSSVMGNFGNLGNEDDPEFLRLFLVCFGQELAADQHSIDRASSNGVVLMSSASAEASVRCEDFAETFPLLAIESHELHLLDWHMVVRRGIDLDARQKHWQFEISDRIGLLVNVLRAQVVSGGFEHVFKSHREIVPEYVVLVANISTRRIPCHELAPILYTGILTPGEVHRILCECRRNDTNTGLQSGDLHHG